MYPLSLFLNNFPETNFDNLHQHTDNDYIFLTRNNIPYSKRFIKKKVKDIVSAVNLTGITPHVLRHAFGSILASEGVNPRVIADILGHMDVNFSYDVYVEAYKDDIKNALNKI